MSEQLINIYDDDQSALILDNSEHDPTRVRLFHNIGEKPITAANPDGYWTGENVSNMKFQNASFLELHVFDENDNFILTINSGKPLLLKPSTGKFYFGEYHQMEDGIIMEGPRHNKYKHEQLEIVRDSHITPIPFDQLDSLDPRTTQKYAIKLSEVFEILKNIPNFNLQKETKFKFQYALFGDLLLQTAASVHLGIGDQNTDQGDTSS